MIKNGGSKKFIKLHIIDVLAIVALISANLVLIRDIKQFRRGSFIAIVILDIFLPIAALSCGFIGMRFLKFTFFLFCFDVLYVFSVAVYLLSRY